MRVNLCFVSVTFVFAVLGCNDLFGIGAPEPIRGETGGSGGSGGAPAGGGGTGGQSGMMSSVSSGVTSSSSTGMPGLCGNGMIDEDEACDPADPASGPKCTSICTVATVVQIAAGAAHTCALFEGGLVKCWGFDANGELGLDAPVDVVGDQPGEMGKSLMPVSLGTGRFARKIAAGTSHTCALLLDDAVKCWGLNSSGQLGLGDTASRGDQPGEMGDSLPEVDLGPGAAVKDIAAGSQHTCALLSNGNIKCWGQNEHGQIGAGDRMPVILGDDPGEMGDALPVVALMAKQIAAGDFHTCAIFDDDSVRCWGYNNVGQLGVGDDIDHGNPIKVPTVGLTSPAKLLWAGGNQSCALQSSGTMTCWGDNTLGQIGALDLQPIGDDPPEAGALPSVSIDSLPGGLFEWSMGKQHSCAIFPAFGVKCWGRNNYGQLAIGATLPNTTEPPAKCEPALLGLGKVTVVGTGAYHACAYATDDGLKCWGRNQAGQLGLGNTKDHGIDPALLGDALPTVKLVSDTW